MAENKTHVTEVDPVAFIAAVANPRRRADAERLLVLMLRATGQVPRMWGPSIVGFGSYHYRYASGREGDSAAAGFSPRKAATVVYLADGVGAHEQRLRRLGPHKVGAGCLYLGSLDDVDLAVLEEIVPASYTTLVEGTYGKRASETRRPLVAPRPRSSRARVWPVAPAQKVAAAQCCGGSGLPTTRDSTPSACDGE